MNWFIVTIQRKDQVLGREVKKDSFTIGRSLECDISLNDGNVSRVHLVVNRRWNQIWVEDKNSSNGTYINGTKIIQGVPVNIVAADKIQIGRSEYFLNIELHSDEEVLADATEADIRAELPEEPLVEDTVAMPPPTNAAPFQAEKIVHEAKRKAAQIILEGENQAEKRVQAIYQKARETQAQAEVFYQGRLTEAHKEADAILSDVQRQAQTLLHDARSMAQELREEVDLYVQTLKEKARDEADNLIADATLNAEKLKTETQREAHEKAQKESEAILQAAREEAERTTEFARLQNKEMQEKWIRDNETLASVSQTLAETEARLQEVSGSLTHLQAEESALRDTLEKEKIRLEALYLEESEKLCRLREEEESRLRSIVEQAQAHVQALKEAQEALDSQNNKLEKSVRALKEKEAHLTLEVQDVETKKSLLYKEYEAQKIVLNEKLQKEKSQMLKTEEERLEEMRLEMSKRLQQMERDLMEDVLRRKESLVKEIHAAVEKEVVTQIEAPAWREVSSQVEAKIAEALEGKVHNLSQSSVISAKPVDFVKKRKRENLRWASVGLAAGLAMYFVAQVAVQTVAADKSPMQTLVKNEAKKRQEDLERRKFNPSQTDEIKETYADAVIYTRNYVDVYLDPQFQERLYKGAAQYLLKTWRVDEDKSIQVIASANALVKELADRRAKIHPDFVRDGIQKMKETETQTLAQMKEILGSEVRVESFRRFERNFYKEEMQRRRMAQH